ncbi:Hypothetical predicted protein, partial [Olea europaea subsp. europaea]
MRRPTRLTLGTVESHQQHRGVKLIPTASPATNGDCANGDSADPAFLRPTSLPHSLLSHPLYRSASPSLSVWLATLQHT